MPSARMNGAAQRQRLATPAGLAQHPSLHIRASFVRGAGAGIDLSRLQLSFRTLEGDPRQTAHASLELIGIGRWSSEFAEGLALNREFRAR